MGSVPHLGLLVSPPRQSLAGDNGTVHVKVVNIGTVPIQVTTHDVLLSRGCGTQTLTHSLTVLPVAFRLKAGGSKDVAVSVHGMAGDYGVSFGYTAATSGRSGITSATPVGARVVTGGTPIACHPVAVGKGSGGLPVLDIVVIAVAAIAVLTAFLYSVSRRRRRPADLPHF